MNEKRLAILRRVEAGELSIEEGSRLLEDQHEISLPPGWGDAAEGNRTDAASPVTSEVNPADPVVQKWRPWKYIPFVLSLALTVVAALWIYQGIDGGRLTVGFWLAWFPFLLGIAGMAFTYRMRWLHVRVVDPKPGKPVRINISLPLPAAGVSWLVRMMGRYGPPMDDEQRTGMIRMIHDALSSRDPVQIQVDEKDGTSVEVVID